MKISPLVGSTSNGQGDRHGVFLRQYAAVEDGQPDALHLLGVVAHQAGRYEEATQYVRRALAAAPNNAEFHNTLGAVALAVGRPADAERAFQQARELKPDYAEAHHNYGLSLESRGAYAEAESAFARAVGLKPRYAAAQLHLGKSRECRGDLEGALACYQAAAQTAPQWWEAQHALGNVSRKRGELQTAEQALRQAVALNARSADTWNCLGVVLSTGQRHAEAADCYRQALSVAPDSGQAHANLGLGLLEHRLPLPQIRDAHEEAVLHLKRAVALDPSAETHNALGQAYHDVREHEEARRCFEEALRLRPGMVPALNNLGNVLLELGDMDEGIEGTNLADLPIPESAQRSSQPGHSPSEGTTLVDVAQFVSGSSLNQVSPSGRSFGECRRRGDRP